MAGALRKTMVYLGLAEDDERYDAYDDYDDDREQSARHEQPARQEQPAREERSAAVTPLPQRTPVARVVRDVEVGGLNRITTVHPRTSFRHHRSAGDRQGWQGVTDTLIVGLVSPRRPSVVGVENTARYSAVA